MAKYETTGIVHRVRILTSAERESLLGEKNKGPLVVPAYVIVRPGDEIMFITRDSDVELTFPEKQLETIEDPFKPEVVKRKLELECKPKGNDHKSVVIKAPKMDSQAQEESSGKEKAQICAFSAFVEKDHDFAEGNSSPKIIIEP